LSAEWLFGSADEQRTTGSFAAEGRASSKVAANCQESVQESPKAGIDRERTPNQPSFNGWISNGLLMVRLFLLSFGRHQTPMRGDPPTVLEALALNAAVLVGFLAVALLMVRRARDPNTVPHDELEARMLPHLENPTRRERAYFGVLLVVGLAAPWLTRYLGA
jgi:hypothetical protein